MEEELIKLPFYLGSEISKILKEKYNIPHRINKMGLIDFSFTKEELSLITALKIKNPIPGSLEGVHLLPNLKTLEVESSAITAHLQEKNILSIGDKDIKSISKCVSLENLSIINQAKVKWLDVSELENLQTLTISHNQHLEEIYGMDSLKKLWELNCYGNNRLFNVGELDQVILNNPELDTVNLDILFFPEAIGYDLKSGEYNNQIVEKLEEMGQVKWCESLNGNRAIKINNYQMIQMHNKACEILHNNVSNSADTRETIVGIETYLSKTVRYDHDARSNGHSNVTKHNFNGRGMKLRRGPSVGANGAYNALIFNTSVCEGYTRAEQYLLKLKGINSHNVDCYAEKDSTGMADGKSENMYTIYKMPDSAEYHSIICIDDYDCLYNDPCWNACYYQAGDKSMPWLLRTKEEISQDHTLSFDERNVSNNHCSIPSRVIQDSIKRNNLFIQSRTRSSSINETKKAISSAIKGKIQESWRE